MAAVFECPACHHICEQHRIPVMTHTTVEDVIYQCGHCSLVYSEAWRQNRERRLREKEG